MPHLTTYSFCVDNNSNSYASVLRDRINSLHPHLHSVFLTHTNKHSCITITGSIDYVFAAKSDLVKLQPIEISFSIDSLYPGFAYRSIARTKLHEQLKSIATQHDIEIVIDYNQIVIKLIGPIDKIEKARIEVLLFFDHQLSLPSNALTMPLHMLNIIGSRRHAHILKIMEETGTNIYLPSPWSKTTQPDTTSTIPIAEPECIVHVTGNTIEAVQRATTSIENSLPEKIKSMCNSQSVLNRRKRDWLLLYKRDELTKIMRDNGSYISFPAFGSDTNQIQVFAENNRNVERTFRSLNYLTSHIFQAVIYVNTVQSADMVARLSQDSGAEVIYRTDYNQFEITGSKEQIQSVVQIIRGLTISQEHHKSVIFSIELAVDQREFISGKKNGKINKIMKSCDAEIQFQPFNDFNFIITIESEDFFKAKDGLDSLQNELPAELSFFVPEICHRRIIGVAGKNIQRVMKQYGVYVKFSSNDELETFGGYFENEHNVVARTPEKNIDSLLKLKAAVMEFITFQKDRDYTSRKEYVPYYMQRNLLYHNGKYLHDKGRLYNSRIGWPERNGTDHVLMTGPQSHIEEMQLRVQSLLPQYIDIQVPASVVLENILKSSDIEELQQKIYAKTNIFLILPENLIMTSAMVDEIDDEMNAIGSDVYQIDDPSFKIEGRNIHMAFYAPNDCRVLTFRLCFDANSKNQIQKARQMFDVFMTSRFVPVDDTLHNNASNGSPSPEDMHHISPAVMHRIDHPESYDKRHAKKTNDVPKLLDQQTQEQPQEQQHSFFHHKKHSTNNELKSSGLRQSSINFLAKPNHYEEKSSTTDEFNVWGDSPSISHNNQKSVDTYNNISLYHPRTHMTKPMQFFYARPELKPHYSTSSANMGSSNNSNMNGFGEHLNYFYTNDNQRGLQQQQQHQRQGQYATSNQGNTFAPIGYSRQRSTSLLPLNASEHYLGPPIQHQRQQHNQQQHQQQQQQHELKQIVPISSSSTSFAPYSFHMNGSMSRIGIGSAGYDHHLNSPRFHPSLDNKNPCSSFSTPIPVAVSNIGNNNMLQPTINSQRFNSY